MFYITIIIGISLQAILALADQTETIIDFYNKINTYGSLLKATSFDLDTQSKLKNINTVRMVSYQIPNNRTLFGIQIKRNLNEQIALIELRCNISNVYVRLGRNTHHRIYHLEMISQSTNTIQSYDLTKFLNNHYQRYIYLLLNYPIEQHSLSIIYYSKSNKNLFSFSTSKNFKRRYRRTILSNNPSSTCAKHEYEIDFNQFTFGQWILQPKRFNAYTCSGSCPNPLSPQYYPSNHAILLSLIHSQKEYGQQPLCVPVRLKPLCLLYYDRDELVIKYHRDMIVQECGCR
ncbi:unnamed protein product [Rotaria sp. Silwood1]|nr:unnamed protein product [Rotaria sp. Silwood1]CAF3872471.1 unnamed protein product [Rotaria sp. Silwood1]CAF3975660.1 unnamed protein product [Rotaria sp. Silwood1]CAF4873063.1 unnamed protein product [Rotaria sp. Silwood1]CAF4908098.1 unnamed protein product [Rotaria sp. Silwood1]